MTDRAGLIARLRIVSNGPELPESVRVVARDAIESLSSTEAVGWRELIADVHDTLVKQKIARHFTEYGFGGTAAEISRLVNKTRQALATQPLDTNKAHTNKAPLLDEVERKKTVISNTISLFVSAIKGGEPWSDVCETARLEARAALEAIRTLPLDD